MRIVDSNAYDQMAYSLGPFQELYYPVRCSDGLCPVMVVCAGFTGTDNHLKAVHRGAVRPDEQRRQGKMLAVFSNSREQLFSCKGLRSKSEVQQASTQLST